MASAQVCELELVLERLDAEPGDPRTQGGKLCRMVAEGAGLGPDLVLGRFGHLWAYCVGPAAGATIAVGTAWLLRGPGGDPGAIAAACFRGLGDQRQPRQ